MAVFKPFRAFRPAQDKAKSVASRPYDVLNSNEARIEAEGNPFSFLHVIKPEIGLSEKTNPYSDEVYLKGAEVYNKFKRDGVLIQDHSPSFYIYRLTMDGRTQTGIVGCCHFEEYYQSKIKKHELTRVAKEEDRVKHVDALSANAEPVFFSYRANKEINSIIAEGTTKDPVFDFIADDEIRHELWVIDEHEITSSLEKLFTDVPCLYVADGHHRTAAAARIGQKRKDANQDHTGQEEYNLFLAVLFADEELEIYDYNRVIKDLHGLTDLEFLSELKNKFSLLEEDSSPIRPRSKGEFSVYLSQKWYLFAPIDRKTSGNPVEDLDVSFLSDHVFEPILGIHDQRKDERIDFVGGIRGLEELSRRVDSGEMAVAFALYPVSMEELLQVADAGEIMPPKSTWFEPKLRSGLFVHELD